MLFPGTFAIGCENAGVTVSRASPAARAAAGASKVIDAAATATRDAWVRGMGMTVSCSSSTNCLREWDGRDAQAHPQRGQV
jgi:hypothetical protein